MGNPVEIVYYGRLATGIRVAHDQSMWRSIGEAYVQEWTFSIKPYSEMMCEWLSRDEWCDVSLLCGGRAFGAHRAVLSSVSSFLRRILLSCPIEETPTLIVLPDFDLEALAAVLYYIYNGEVTIPRQKLGKFLDIVKAMQIFIDQQYLTQFSINIDIEYSVNKCVTEERFVLRSENEDNSSLVTFRKLIQNTFPRNTKDATDYNDQASQNLNEQFMPVLGNLQSAHGGRQRDYFLRDSFMETYPRNRNANGRAGVPAIPSRCYLSPTSPLLTNTNANVIGYLSPDTVNLPCDNDATSQMPYNLKLASNLLKPYQDNITVPELHRKFSIDASNCWPGHTTDSSLETYVTKNHAYLGHSILQKTHTAMPSSVINKMPIDKLPKYSDLGKMEYRTERLTTNLRDTNPNKVSILNKALESPWCPRLPSSFRPFRRKGPSLNTFHPNDNNNNIQVKSERLETGADLRNNNRLVSTVASSLEDDKDSSNILPSCTEVSSRGRYTCNECGKTFSQLRNFKYHMSVHRGTREFAASCAVCGKSFNDRGYLSSHMKIHRNRKEYKCSQCPKSFNQRVAYNMHVRIHTGIKPHVCPTCGKAFSRKMLLKQHQRTHSGERPYACPHCEKRFADRSNMTLHLRLHTGVKPFKCPMCPKSFTKKHHLKSHVNFHTGAKPYSCPRCRLAFTQSSNMRTHLKRCTAPDPSEATAEVST